MKTCSNCNTEKPFTEFFKHKYSKDGLQARCKCCANLYYKKPGTLQKYVARSRANTIKHQALFKELKSKLSCALCDEPSKACLDFHHTDPSVKEKCVSSMIGTTSWENVLKEIDKCVCVCRNCHAKIHAGEISLPE